MKKLDSILLKIFLWSLPVDIVIVIFICWHDANASQAGGLIEDLYNFCGLIFGAWMLLAIYLCVRLMVSGLFREKVLSRLTFIKERDEREALFTGKAAKTTMLTSLAILIFLFCLSCFQVSVYRLPPEKAVDGQTGTISLGLGFSLLENYQPEKSEETQQNKNIVAYTGLPVSSSTVILGLIAWQIFAYNYTMRRMLK